MKSVMSLIDGPVFIANLAVMIDAAAEILPGIDRDKAAAVIADIDRASSMLSIAHLSCLLTVEAIEAGPDYVGDVA